MPQSQTTPSPRTTAALDRFTARLPYGDARNAVELVGAIAGLGNRVAARWCQQLVRDARTLPPPPDHDEGGWRFDADFNEPVDQPAAELAERSLDGLWADCESVLHGLRRLGEETARAPGRELATVGPVRTAELRRVVGLGEEGGVR
jgi:hypothetical protein